MQIGGWGPVEAGGIVSWSRRNGEGWSTRKKEKRSVKKKKREREREGDVARSHDN